MTISAEAALINRALADSAVAALVSTRIYLSRAPEQPVMPFIVFYRIAATRHHAMNGASGLVKLRVQASIFSKTMKEALSIGDALRLSFDDFIGDINSVTVQAILLESEFESYEPQVDVKSIIQQYQVWAAEAV